MQSSRKAGSGFSRTQSEFQSESILLCQSKCGKQTSGTRVLIAEGNNTRVIHAIIVTEATELKRTKTERGSVTTVVECVSLIGRTKPVGSDQIAVQIKCGVRLSIRKIGASRPGPGITIGATDHWFALSAVTGCTFRLCRDSRNRAREDDDRIV